MYASGKVKKCGGSAGFDQECENCVPLVEMVIVTGLHLLLKMPEGKKLLESKCKRLSQIHQPLVQIEKA